MSSCRDFNNNTNDNDNNTDSINNNKTNHHDNPKNNNMDTMNEHGQTVYLDVSPGDLALRIMEEGVENRPIFKSYDQVDLIQEIRTLREKREEFYNQSKIKIRDNQITVEMIISNLCL